MQTRTVISLAAAGALGLGAVLVARVYVSSVQPNTASANDPGYVPVVVASQPLTRGFKLQPTVLKLARYPADAVPPGAFRTVAEASSAQGGARIVLKDVASNEPILADRVSGPGGRMNLSGALGAGMRAVSLRANDVAGVGGFVLPGDRVDVLLTRTQDGNDQSTSLTQVLAQNVRVVGVDQSDNQAADKPVVVKAITVEVSPDEAQAITLAQSVGAVSLALRQISDQAPLTRQMTTMADLSRHGAQAVIPVAPVRPRAPSAPRPRVRPQVAETRDSEVHVTRGVMTTGYQVGS